MKDLKKYLTESFTTIVTESSFKRVIDNILNNEIAVVTAFRGSYPKKENRERNRELFHALLRAGYNVTKLDGVYIENYKQSNAALCDEDSFLVVNDKNDKNFYDNLFKLSAKYDQDSFLYKGKDEEIGVLVGTNDTGFPGYGNTEPAGKLKTDIENEFMSRLKNKGFAFVNDDEPRDAFHTSHEDRKKQRIEKRLHKSIKEEFETIDIDFVRKHGVLSTQGIALHGDRILKEAGIER